MKNLIKRAFTGIIFVGVLAGAIYFSPYTFGTVFTLVTGLLLWEFYGLAERHTQAKPRRLIGSIGGAYLFLATFLYAHGLGGSVVFLPYLLYLMYIFIGELYYKAPNPIHNWALTLLAQIYCAGTFSLLNFIVLTGKNGEGTTYYPLFALAIFVFIWLNDTGAYLVGSSIGKHKLFPRISPKKSWEGFYGGMIVTLASSQAFAWFDPAIGWYNWLGLSAVVVLFGTWGDLTESLLKRTFGVKDSGTMIPGHGGILDRFDSLLLAIPAAYMYIELFIRN